MRNSHFFGEISHLKQNEVNRKSLENYERPAARLGNFYEILKIFFGKMAKILRQKFLFTKPNEVIKL